MPIENTPIENVGTKYVYGLMLSWVSNTQLNVNVGMARSQSNLNDIILGTPDLTTATIGATIDATRIGVNGLDAGTLVANLDYSVYVIADSTKNNPTACILSTNFNSTIVFPSGYDMCRRIGLVMTDGSANIRKFYQYGRSTDRTYYMDVPINVLTGGSATTFTSINLSGALPYSGPFEVYAQLSYTPALAANFAEFLPFGSTATSGIVKFGCGSAANQNGNVWIPTASTGGVPFMLYKVVASDSLTISIAGFKDYLSIPQ